MQYLASNQWKEKASGKIVVMVPLILFTDDTSGNRSKKWNKFDSWYLLLAGLGRHANAKPSNIHFVTTSNKVSPLDQCVPIVEELLLLESEGIEVYDAFNNCQALVVAPLLCVICDNPRAQELCNQLASTTRKFCMADKVDSPDAIGVPRTRERSLLQMAEISSQTSVGKTYETRKKYGIKERYNPMLHIKADIYRLKHPIRGSSCFFGLERQKIFMPLFTDTQKQRYLPEYGHSVCKKGIIQRPKIHLILHLVDCIEQYGPTSAFSAERCESFNSDVRAQNVFSNREAPSHDIANHFAVLEHVRHIMDGGRYDGERHLLKDLSSHKGIYKPGTPRLASKHNGHLSLGALSVTVPGLNKCILSGLTQQEPPFVFSCHHVQLDDKVTEYRGIVAQSFQLVHTGDYVELDVPWEALLFIVQTQTLQLLAFQPAALCQRGPSLLFIVQTQALHLLQLLAFQPAEMRQLHVVREPHRNQALNLLPSEDVQAMELM
eukprot:Em0011g2a